jgi:membrane-associated phospholipid phosphatase
MGRIKSLEMESNEERKIPYISTALYYFSLYYLFYNAEFPNIFKILILGASISILLTFLINFQWKISAHTIGIGGIAGAALGIIYRLHIDLYFILMIILLVSGLVAYARLKLNAHTPAQVYTGFLLGFFVELLLMIFY